MKAPISCIAIFDGAEIFRDADCERVQSLQLAMTFNLLSAERDRLRTELAAAREQIEQRDAFLEAYQQFVSRYALTSSGLDVSDHKG